MATMAAAAAGDSTGAWRSPNISVTVSRAQYGSNIKLLKELAAPAKLLVVVKSNAYGHGLRQLVPTAVRSGADALGICPNAEARQVREAAEDESACKHIPLFRLRMALPEEVEECLAEGLEVEEQLGTLESGRWMSDMAVRSGTRIRVHINVDTGMGRSGFLPEEVADLKEAIKLPGLQVVGAFTHFPNSDDTTLDETEAQLSAFHSFMEAVKGELPEGVVTHVANSAALARMPHARGEAFGMVRAGAATFDARTSTEFKNPVGLAPCMTIKTKVAQVRRMPAGKTIGYGSKYTTSKETHVAALPVGFGEGYPRKLANLGVVLIHGKRCNVVGKVSLNITTVDVTPLFDDGDAVAVGDEVVLFGTQGAETMTFEEMADRIDSVHTEIQLHMGHLNPVEWVD